LHGRDPLPAARALLQDFRRALEEEEQARGLVALAQDETLRAHGERGRGRDDPLRLRRREPLAQHRADRLDERSIWHRQPPRRTVARPMRPIATMNAAVRNDTLRSVM